MPQATLELFGPGFSGVAWVAPRTNTKKTPSVMEGVFFCCKAGRPKEAALPSGNAAHVDEAGCIHGEQCHEHEHEPHRSGQERRQSESDDYHTYEGDDKAQVLRGTGGADLHGPIQSGHLGPTGLMIPPATIIAPYSQPTSGQNKPNEACIRCTTGK